MKHLIKGYWLTLSLLLLSSLPSHANQNRYTVEDILALPEAPSGVIFEIVTGDKMALDWVLPVLNQHISQLRARFPKLAVAVVTHGREQFALQTEEQTNNQEVHQLTKQMINDGINVHVCGTHAQWRGLSDEDFPEHINVSASGPAQVNDYLGLGYLLVKIE